MERYEFKHWRYCSVYTTPCRWPDSDCTGEIRPKAHEYRNTKNGGLEVNIHGRK